MARNYRDVDRGVSGDPGASPVVQQVTLPIDGVRWGPVWAGFLAALTALLLLSLLGLAIGLTTIDAGTAASQGTLPADTARNSGIWAAVAAIIAFLVGGFVAGRAAAITTRGWGALNGAMVFLLSVPLLLWFTSQGLGTLVGNLGYIAGSLHINLGHAASSVNPGQVSSAANSARTVAWGTLIGIILVLAASAAGGSMGVRTDAALQRPRVTAPTPKS